MKKTTVKKTARKPSSKKTAAHSAAAPEAVVVVKKNFGLNKIILSVIAALVLLLVYVSVDQLTGWGDASKIIKRRIAEAEKQSFSRQYTRAARIYESIVEKYGDDEKFSEYTKQASLGLAKSYADSQQYIKAIDAYKELAEEYKNVNRDMYAWLLLELGNCYNNIFNSKDAITVFNKIIKDFPETDWSAEAYFGIADAHRNSGSNKEALAYYGRIVNKYQKGFLSAEALTNMGKIYESEGKDAEAVRIYERIVKDFPEIVTEYARMRMDALKIKPAK